MTGRLQDKVAIITGAGRGIGEAIARAFHHEGALVVIAELEKSTGEAVASDLSSNGASALFAPCDVRQTHSAEAVARLAREAFGRIDILINNAGINVFYDPLETSEAEWRRCFDIDLDGVWRMSTAGAAGHARSGRRLDRQHRVTHSFSVSTMRVCG